MSKSKAQKVEHPKRSVSEIRALLGADCKKLEKIAIPDNDFNNLVSGDLKDIAKNFMRYAKGFGVTTDFRISRERFTKSTGRYGGRYTVVNWAIVTERPYTDAELEKQGEKLLKGKKQREARVAKARAKKIAQFNRLAKELGQSPVET